MKYNVLVLCMCFLFFLAASPVFSLRITDFYQSVTSGEWIEMKSTDGMLTKTEVIGIVDGLLHIKIVTKKKTRILSIAQEFIDVKTGKIEKIIMKSPDGDDRVIYPDEEMQGFMALDFQEKNTEEIIVPAGTFQCKRYRAIYDDYVIDAWISDEVPIIKLVKVRMRGMIVELTGYGAVPGE